MGGGRFCASSHAWVAGFFLVLLFGEFTKTFGTWMFMDFQQNQKYISGWWYTQPSEKSWSGSQLG